MEHPVLAINTTKDRKYDPHQKKTANIMVKQFHQRQRFKIQLSNNLLVQESCNPIKIAHQMFPHLLSGTEIGCYKATFQISLNH